MSQTTNFEEKKSPLLIRITCTEKHINCAGENSLH